MKKVLKIVSIAICVIVILLIAGSVALKLYFTQQRIKELVIPHAEKILERKVDFESASIGLFSGISVKGFVIKEKNAKADFVRVEKFVLKCKLLPLLRREIVVTKIALIKPYIHIVREKNGRFNYEDLTFKGKAKGKPTQRKVFNLTISRIDIEKAAVKFEDELKEIPGINAIFDLTIEPPSGKAKFNLRLSLRKEIFKFKGNAVFGPQELKYDVAALINNQKIFIKGKIENYTRKPLVLLNIYSPLLKLDKLLAMKKVFAEEKRGDSPGKNSFKGINVKGHVKIDRLSYRTLTASDLEADYSFSNGLLNLRNLKFKLVGGTFLAKGQIDLKRFWFKGKLKISSLDLSKLAETNIAFVSLKGILSGNLSFSGIGKSILSLKKTLNATGSIEIKKLSLSGSEIFEAIAELLSLEELAKPSFSKAQASFVIKQGKLILKSTLKGDSLSVEAKGAVGLAGWLNIPLSVKLSRKLSEKLLEKMPFLDLLPRENGRLIVPVRLKGTLEKPVPILETERMKRKLRKDFERILERLLK